MMNLTQITQKLEQVSDVYARKFNIRRDDDWFILKIQEELGELTSAHLKLSKRARTADATRADLEKNLQDEVADVLALTLLYAKHKGIDVDQALQNKWFKYL
jgi:NTP pyrophosphatase (non-canonical NTP hydrolase)